MCEALCELLVDDLRESRERRNYGGQGMLKIEGKTRRCSFKSHRNSN